MAGENLLIDDLDTSMIAEITDATGLLAAGPVKGTLLSFPFAPGGTWVSAGDPDVYSFDVPMVLTAGSEAQRMADLATIQSYRGRPVVLTRIADLGAGLVEHTMTAVITGDITPGWDLNVRTRVDVVLVFQSLTGVWVPA